MASCSPEPQPEVEVIGHVDEPGTQQCNRPGMVVGDRQRARQEQVGGQPRRRLGERLGVSASERLDVTTFPPALELAAQHDQVVPELPARAGALAEQRRPVRVPVGIQMEQATLHFQGEACPTGSDQLVAAAARAENRVGDQAAATVDDPAAPLREHVRRGATEIGLRGSQVRLEDRDDELPSQRVVLAYRDQLVEPIAVEVDRPHRVEMTRVHKQRAWLHPRAWVPGADQRRVPHPVAGDPGELGPAVAVEVGCEDARAVDAIREFGVRRQQFIPGRQGGLPRARTVEQDEIGARRGHAFVRGQPDRDLGRRVTEEVADHRLRPQSREALLPQRAASRVARRDRATGDGDARQDP
jgi:hypothetical protein